MTLPLRSVLGPAVLASALIWLAAFHAAAEPRTVVVLVFDGAAPALLERAPTPSFDRIRAEGAWSHALQPPFPSISLIGGVTLSTGCWPENHGIVSNEFIDPQRGRYDHSSDADWLTGCEHLHVAAERQGVRAAALGWYGAFSGTRGPLASVVGEPSFAEFPNDPGRTEQVVRELTRQDAERPRLVLGYFKGPDSAGHFQGIESEEARTATVAMDTAVGRVLEAIEQGPGREQTTLFVTTDHGMMPVSDLVNIERILHWHDVAGTAVASGTSAFIYLNEPGDADSALQALSGYEEFDVYRRGAFPAYARLGDGPRVGDLLVAAKPPYFIENAGRWPWYLRWLARFGPRISPAGGLLAATHGYRGDEPGVAGLFYAWGAGIAAGREVGTLRAVDLHPTAMHVLGLEAGSPVDGQVAEGFLQQPSAAR